MIAEESHEQLQEKQQASAINNSSELNKITTDITSPGLQALHNHQQQAGKGHSQRKEAKPKSFGVLKMPVKRATTMQLKKTVTFANEKNSGVEPHPDLKLDYSYLSITE